MLKTTFVLMIFASFSSSILAHTETATEPVPVEGFMQVAGWDFSEPPRTEKLAEGFYVLFGYGGNILVSSGEDGVIVVDDQFPQAWPGLLKAMKAQGDEAIDFVINTHWHFDHADGNRFLGEKDNTWIVSQSNSREMMKQSHVVDLVSVAVEQPAYADSALPDITFDESMQFHLNGQQIELVHAGPAHTTGDAAVIFRGNNAVHMGDVYNNSGYPFIDSGNGGSIDGAIVFCNAILAKIDEETTVIPGHGPIASKADLSWYIGMLEETRAEILKLIEAGKSLEEVLDAGITAKWDEKMGDPVRFINRSYMSLKN